jgi:hypothetical protein
MFYNRYDISPDSIEVFFSFRKKSDNDSNNGLRESIISAIINKKIPDTFFLCEKWISLRRQIHSFIEKLKTSIGLEIISDINFTDIVCIPKGGRCFHYDFVFVFDKVREIKIEFKFNASTVHECPQFVSPGKPSRFMDINYEEWFYDNGLKNIADYADLVLPEKSEYLKTIHSNKVEVMKYFKLKYDNDIPFNNYCKKIDKQTNKKFLDICKLNIDQLSSYLYESQKDKYFMCYLNGEFFIDSLDKSLFQITEYHIQAPNFICKTKIGYNLEVKLRWKNGHGIQYPAFQISRKFPSKNDLISLCKLHDIEFSSRNNKSVLINILTEKGIVF